MYCNSSKPIRIRWTLGLLQACTGKSNLIFDILEKQVKLAFYTGKIMPKSTFQSHLKVIRRMHKAGGPQLLLEGHDVINVPCNGASAALLQLVALGSFFASLCTQASPAPRCLAYWQALKADRDGERPMFEDIHPATPSRHPHGPYGAGVMIGS